MREVWRDSDGNDQEHYRWKSVLTESSQTDFLLADAAGQSVWVPAGSCLFGVISQQFRVDDGLFCNPLQPNPPLFSLLERHGVNVAKYFGSASKPRIRYREESFSVNDLVAVLGTPTQSQINGVPVLVLNPATSDCFDEAYFEKNGWGERERMSWKQHTNPPSLLAANQWEYFKGVYVDTLPVSYQCAGGLGTPVAIQAPPIQPGHLSLEGCPPQEGFPPQQGFRHQQVYQALQGYLPDEGIPPHRNASGQQKVHSLMMTRLHL